MENILHRYKNRSKDMFKFNLYKYKLFRFFKDKVINSQFFEFKLNND